MHEYSLIQALLDRVGREVAAHRATRVHRLWVRVGELSGVEVELLKTAYEMCRERTVCDGAPLEVAWQEARWACPHCETTIGKGERLICPVCETPARLVAGDELMLDRIELEVA